MADVAKSLGYFANIRIYHDWSRLILQTEDQAESLVSIHGMGHEYRGVLAASVGFYKRLKTADDQLEKTAAVAACEVLSRVSIT